MITIGYGDIIPGTNLERLFATFSMIFASGLFGYTMNSMGTVIARFEMSKSLFESKIDSVNRYLKQRKIDNHLQIRIRKYLEYIWNLNNCNEMEEE